MNTTEERYRWYGGTGVWAAAFLVTLAIGTMAYFFYLKRAEARQLGAIEAVSGKVDGLSEKVDGVGQRVSGIESRVDESAKAVAEAVSRMEGFAEQFDGSLEELVAAVSDVAKRSSDGFSELRESVDREAGARQALDRSVDEGLSALSRRIEEKAKADSVEFAELRSWRSGPQPVSGIPDLPGGARPVMPDYRGEVVLKGAQSSWVWSSSVRKAGDVLVTPMPGIEAVVRRGLFGPTDVMDVPDTGVVQIPGGFWKVSFRLKEEADGTSFVVWTRR